MVIEMKKYDNGRSAMSLQDRILSSIEIDDGGCWNWTKRTLNKWGYARMTVGSRRDNSRKTDFAHRVSYREFIGEIPEGLAIDHLCINAKCVNPFHLEPVTTTENNKRKRLSRCGICDELKIEKYDRLICLSCVRKSEREHMRKRLGIKPENYRIK